MELQYKVERYYTPKWYLLGFIPVGGNLIRTDEYIQTRKVGETGWTTVKPTYEDFYEDSEGMHYPKV